MLNLSKIRLEVESIVREAGDLLLSYFKNGISYKYKVGQGLVTEADLQSEKFLIDKLSQLLPQASLYAEESGAQGNSSFCWVIDPLDGTTNFVHNIPYFCISVALTKNNKPILGLVYQPFLNEMFSAVKGKGAFLNNCPISVSATEALDQMFLVVGIPYDKTAPYLQEFVKYMPKLIEKTFAFRHFGAVALDMAYVASGKCDAILFEDMFWWDFAAGSLLIQEAGGVVSDFSGGDITLDSKTLIGSNEAMHQVLRDFFEREKKGFN